MTKTTLTDPRETTTKGCTYVSKETMRRNFEISTKLSQIRFGNINKSPEFLYTRSLHQYEIIRKWRTLSGFCEMSRELSLTCAVGNSGILLRHLPATSPSKKDLRAIQNSMESRIKYQILIQIMQ